MNTQDKQFMELVERLIAESQRVGKWKLVMSYNASYFGEPVGELKSAAHDINRTIDLIDQYVRKQKREAG